jgi:hypothetical protein
MRKKFQLCKDFLTFLKESVSRDKYFFNGSKNQIITFCMSTDGFRSVWLLFCGESEN